MRIPNASTAAVYGHATNNRAVYLAWVENGNLMAQPFESETADVRGQAVALAQNVKSDESAARFGEVSASKSGILIYATASQVEHQLTWFGRDGKPIATIGQPDAYEGLRISPDGRAVGVSRVQTASHSAGVAFVEFNRGITTHFGPGFWGAWSPDGERIALSGGRGVGAPKIFAVPINHPTEREQLTHSPNSEI